MGFGQGQYREFIYVIYHGTQRILEKYIRTG